MLHQAEVEVEEGRTLTQQQDKLDGLRVTVTRENRRRNEYGGRYANNNCHTRKP